MHYNLFPLEVNDNSIPWTQDDTAKVSEWQEAGEDADLGVKALIMGLPYLPFNKMEP